MLWAGCVSFWGAVALAVLQGQQPQVVAHVLDVKGEWHSEGSAELITAGRGLLSGARIVAGSNRPGDAITIVRDEDMSRIRIACDVPSGNPCRNSIAVQGPSSEASSQSQLKNIVQAAISVLISKPPAIVNHYALTLARGKTVVQDSEAVVALDQTQSVVLPPASERLAAGTYTISSVSADQTSSVPNIQSDVLTSEGTWRPLPWNTPGLFEVSIIKPNGEKVADTMLLVVSAERYPELREKFDTLKARTETWTGSSSQEDQHLFLRAFLFSQRQP